MSLELELLKRVEACRNTMFGRRSGPVLDQVTADYEQYHLALDAFVRRGAAEHAARWEAYSDRNQDMAQSRSLYFIPFPRSQDADREWAESEARRERQGDDFRFTIENRDGQIVGILRSIIPIEGPAPSATE